MSWSASFSNGYYLLFGSAGVCLSRISAQDFLIQRNKKIELVYDGGQIYQLNLIRLN